MVILDVRLKKIYGFDEFHMNFSYPRKLSAGRLTASWRFKIAHHLSLWSSWRRKNKSRKSAPENIQFDKRSE